MKNYYFKFLAVILSAVMVFGTVSVFSEPQNSEPQFEELSQDFLDYINLDESERSGIVAPFPAEIKQEHNNDAVLSSVLPERYDGRDYEYLPPVKNQMSTGTCWAFSATTALAASMQKQYPGNIFDFSVRHMENSEAINPNDLADPDSLNRYVDGGGYGLSPLGYFMRGAGPVDESEMPFQNNIEAENKADLLIKPIAQVKEAEYMPHKETFLLPDTTDEFIAEAKYNIMKYGAAGCAYYSYDPLYNMDKNSFYNNQRGTYQNHAVTIIGWDDNFSADNFVAKPPADGAWIIQNSLGSDWGDDGCFYMSYYDETLDELIFYQDSTPYLEYDNRYYLDPAGWTRGLGYPDSNGISYGMNIFEKLPGEEALTEVTIGVRGDTDYSIYVIPDADKIDPASYDTSKDTPVCTGNTDHAGYITAELQNPVILDGERFAVIVKYSCPSYIYSLPVEARIKVYTEYYHLAAEPGTSYISAEGKDWTEISNEKYDYANCSIKAFTKDITPKTEVTFETLDPKGIMSVYDKDGRKAAKKADGSFALPNGNYTYVQSTYHCKDVTGTFSVSGEESITVKVEGKMEPGDYSPELIKRTYEYEKELNSDGSLSVGFDLGKGTLAAENAVACDEGIPLELGADYNISGNSIVLTPEYLNAVRNYMMPDGGSWVLEIKFDDDKLTEYQFVIKFESLTVENVADELINELRKAKPGALSADLVALLPKFIQDNFTFLFNGDLEVESSKNYNFVTCDVIVMSNDGTYKRLAYDNQMLYKVVMAVEKSHTLTVRGYGDVSGTLFICQYDGSGLLIDSKPYTLELKNGDELDFPYEIVEGSVRREFFFFDMNTLEPLAKY